MATLKTTVAANWSDRIETPVSGTRETDKSVWMKYLAFVDGQRSNRTLWFFISLMIHATIFLPLPILLIGYFNAPVAVLGLTMVSFFANFVANMGGSGIRTTLSCFFASIIIHVTMVFLVLILSRLDKLFTVF